MQILPNKRPSFKESSFEKVCRYFLGNDWKTLYPIVELAIRNPKIAFYNDELAVWTKLLKGIRSFNWNADPSAYIVKGQPKAILKKGVHFYKLSYHKIWDNSKRYVALRPATTGEELPVWRRDSSGKLSSSVGTAINQHKGGSDSTWSEGCQTAHFSQYPEFIKLIGDALGIKVQLGVIKNPDSRLTKGVGKFPYILIEQADFNYILNLPESEFDNAADLKYQAQNFVGVPKIEVKKPIETEIENANAILEAVEIEAEENLNLFEIDKTELHAAGDKSQAVAISEPMSVIDGNDEMTREAAATDGAASPTTQTAENITNVDNSTKMVPDNFKPENKTVDAPPPSGMMKKAWLWVLSLGIVPPSAGAVIETIRNLSADGSLNLKDSLLIAGQVGKFVFPYVVYLAIAFVVIWGIKELLKQISLMLKIYVTGRADMNNVEVKPIPKQPYIAGDWMNAPVETKPEPLSAVDNTNGNFSGNH
jgi:hypothetical protein